MDVGIKASDFSCSDHRDETFSLADHRGQKVLLSFHPLAWTPVCAKQMQSLERQAGTFADLETVVIGISADSPTSHQNFVDKHTLQQILLSDEQHTALQAYGVWQKKKMYGKSFYGIVRSTMLVNPDGIVAAWWPKVRVAGHVDEVLETLKGLRA